MLQLLRNSVNGAHHLQNSVNGAHHLRNEGKRCCNIYGKAWNLALYIRQGSLCCLINLWGLAWNVTNFWVHAWIIAQLDRQARVGVTMVKLIIFLNPWKYKFTKKTCNRRPRHNLRKIFLQRTWRTPLKDIFFRVYTILHDILGFDTIITRYFPFGKICA